jgi:hypothetical protein
MDLELILKILVKFTITALIGFRAVFKSNVTFHVMDTGPLGKGKSPEPLSPANNPSLFSFQGFALAFQGFIGTTDPGQCSVKPAAKTQKIVGALFFFDHPCLHPEAGR